MKTKTILYILLMALVSLQVSAVDESKIFSSQYLIIDTNILTEIAISRDGRDPSIQYLNANMGFFPISTEGQTLLSSDHSPTPRKINEKDAQMSFRIERPGSRVPINIKNRVKVERQTKRIDGKISFPLGHVPVEVQKYTQEAKIIDINDDIIQLSSSLADGEDDLIIVVDKIASWVTQNIKYNLSSAAAEATEKSSTVLRTREGVCDEMTALFISMVRSVGLPARFVAGLAYSNAPELATPWSPHGWSEVWFPGHGWVPYDVTYGQYGSVDASHIVTEYALDSKKIKSKFAWKGRGTTVEVKKFEPTANILEYGPALDPKIDLELKMLKGSVGFGSYNLAKVHVRNLVNYYQPVDVFIARTAKLSLEDPDTGKPAPFKQHLLLAPGEEKVIFWHLRVSEDLKDNLIYTFPVSVYTGENIEDKSEFKVIKGGIQVSEKRMTKTKEGLAPGENKTRTSAIDLNCITNKQRFQEDEDILITCNMHNRGNVMLNNLMVCLEGRKCRETSLGITRKEEVGFTLSPNEKDFRDIGENKLTILASNNELASSTEIDFTVLDKPLLQIKEITAPKTVEYHDVFTTTLHLKKESMVAPQDVKLLVESPVFSQEFILDEVNNGIDLHVEMHGEDMVAGNNQFSVSATFADEFGTRYESRKSFSVELINVTFWQKVKIFFNTLFKTG